MKKLLFLLFFAPLALNAQWSDYGDLDGRTFRKVKGSVSALDVYLVAGDSLTVISMDSLITLVTAGNIKLDSTLVNVMELNGLTQTQIDSIAVANGILRTVKTAIDTTNENVKEGNTISEQIETELLAIGVDADSTLQNVKEGNGLLQNVRTNTESIIDELQANTLIDTLYGVVTLTTASTAYQFSALSSLTMAVESVKFTNFTSGAIVYYGINNSLTTANGAEPAFYTWTRRRYGDSTTDFWLISDTNTTLVRYSIIIKR